MKTILTTFIALVITSVATAQSPDKSLARVRYSFSHLRDTTQRDKPYTENMLLVIGKNASVFTSFDKISSEIDMQNQIKEQMKNQAGGGPMNISINRTSSKPTSSVDYFLFVKENKLFIKEKMFNDYIIEQEAPKFNWKLEKDTASFSGVKCQKATTYFKGRNWIAWYAPELPFQSGPWKLSGLPGLIIEAYDEKKEVQFTFAGIENIKSEDVATTRDDSPKIITPNGTVGMLNIVGMDGGSVYLGQEIKLPATGIKTTQKEFDKLKEARDKDPQGFMNAQMAASGVTLGVSRSSVSSTVSTPRKSPSVINNPIELPEKK